MFQLRKGWRFDRRETVKLFHFLYIIISRGIVLHHRNRARTQCNDGQNLQEEAHLAALHLLFFTHSLVNFLIFFDKRGHFFVDAFFGSLNFFVHLIYLF